MLDKLTLAMTEYFRGDPKRIQHFLKVRSLARLIGSAEGLSARELFTLEAAALTHDIGIKPAEAQYGECGGKLQERLGPPEAEKLLKALCFDGEVIERVCHLISRHHTYTDIDGQDLQILIEADFLVNLYEDAVSKEGILAAYQSIFSTETGKRLCRDMFGIEA